MKYAEIKDMAGLDSARQKQFPDGRISKKIILPPGYSLMDFTESPEKSDMTG